MVFPKLVHINSVVRILMPYYQNSKIYNQLIINIISFELTSSFRNLSEIIRCPFSSLAIGAFLLPETFNIEYDDFNKTKLKDIVLLKGAGWEMLPASCGVACQSRKHFSNDENRTGRIAAHHGLADIRNCPDPAQKDYQAGEQ